MVNFVKPFEKVTKLMWHMMNMQTEKLIMDCSVLFGHKTKLKFATYSVNHENIRD